MVSYSRGDYRIKSNLKVLLAKNDIKLSKVSVDTGISRTTLTALSEGHSKGVQFDTLNTLCNYFNISPSDFFSYFPLDIEIKITDINITVSDHQYMDGEIFFNAKIDSIELYAVVKKYNKQAYTIELVGNGIISGFNEFIEINVKINDKDENFNTFKSDFSKLSPDLVKYFYKVTEESLFNQLSEYEYMDKKITSGLNANTITLHISNVLDTPF